MLLGELVDLHGSCCSRALSVLSSCSPDCFQLLSMTGEDRDLPQHACSRRQQHRKRAHPIPVECGQEKPTGWWPRCPGANAPSSCSAAALPASASDEGGQSVRISQEGCCWVHCTMASEKSAWDAALLMDLSEHCVPASAVETEACISRTQNTRHLPAASGCVGRRRRLRATSGGAACHGAGLSSE